MQFPTANYAIDSETEIMALTFDVRPAGLDAHRTGPHAILDTAPSPALTRRRQAEALVSQAEALTDEAWTRYLEAKDAARELLTRALALDISLPGAWKQGAEHWRYQGEAPAEYARWSKAAEAAKVERKPAKKKQPLAWQDVALLLAVFGIPFIIGIALGAWLF
jgi:hypothetical protein